MDVWVVCQVLEYVQLIQKPDGWAPQDVGPSRRRAWPSSVTSGHREEGVMGAFRSIDLFSFVLWIVVVFTGWLLAKTFARRPY